MLSLLQNTRIFIYFLNGKSKRRLTSKFGGHARFL